MHDGAVRVPHRPAVDLVVPVKSLRAAKSRLRGAADHGLGDPVAHARLVLAQVLDTVEAARAAASVRRLVVVTSDTAVAAELAELGVESVPEGPVAGLNGALAHAAGRLAVADPAASVGALQADLPALRAHELEAALAVAAALFAAGADRAFCADTSGLGTTLLVAAPGTALQPAFGIDSAHRHAASGARPLTGPWPGLRRDVDTPEDLNEAAELGLGRRTGELISLCRNGELT